MTCVLDLVDLDSVENLKHMEIVRLFELGRSDLQSFRVLYLVSWLQSGSIYTPRHESDSQRQLATCNCDTLRATKSGTLESPHIINAMQWLVKLGVLMFIGFLDVSQALPGMYDVT